MKACCESTGGPDATGGGNSGGANRCGRLRIAIAGNPNCGKTTLFNRLTGASQRTGNWPGVTVEQKIGVHRDDAGEIEIIDLPGVYTIRPFSEDSDQALDEKLARDAIVRGEFDAILNIVDASNLERNLYLTAQLLETGRPLVIALNMMDVARKSGLAVDAEALSRVLGVPVVPISARRGEGLSALLRAVREVACAQKRPAQEVRYPPAVEKVIEALLPIIDYTARREGIDPRWLAVRLIEGDDLALRLAGEETAGVLRYHLPKLERALGEAPDLAIASARYALAHRAAQAAVRRRGEMPATWSDRIDRVVLHPLAGPAVFLLAMYVMFLLTINVGGAFIDFFDILAGAIFVEGAGYLLSAAGAPEWLRVILADGLGSGIQTVATFVPVIGMLFLVLSFLEDSGYMVRAAFLMDRWMRAIGLPGKAFVPLIVGFGCNVPAIMAARTLESRRDRILTVMMAPFMSCGARLTVYALFAAAFFSAGGQNVVFLLYLIGILAAVGTGFLLKRTLLKGEPMPFVMELPPYRLPHPRNMLLHAWMRLRGFIFGAGRIIVIIVAALAVANSLGTDGSFGNEGTEKSLLSAAGRAIVPAFEPMGIREDNWPATVGIFTGVFAKEAVVGTLNALYATIDHGQAAADGKAEEFDFPGRVREALASIPENLRSLGAALADPLGLAEVTAAPAAEESQVFGAMVRRFDGRIGAFAYMLFILLYFPCVAAFSAMVRETGWRWALIAGGWSLWLAWFAAVGFYQAATWAAHPLSSGLWIGGLVLAMAAIVWLFHLAGRRGSHGGPMASEAAAE
jgi:ferrous iron transport protein B